MNIRCLPLAAALALSTGAASAETRPPVPAAIASAPTVIKSGPRLVSPVEMNQNASPPGELRPENPVTPQIVIPLRNPPPAALASEKPALRSGKTAGGVNDAAARCEALTDAAARRVCLDKVRSSAVPR